MLTFQNESPGHSGQVFGTQNFTEEECCFLISNQSAKQYKLEAKSSLDGRFTSVKQILCSFSMNNLHLKHQIFSLMREGNRLLFYLKSGKLRYPSQRRARIRGEKCRYLKSQAALHLPSVQNQFQLHNSAVNELPQALVAMQPVVQDQKTLKRVKVQTVIQRCKCMFWRENGSHSGHWEAHLRNPKSKQCHHGSC